jgi:hypothetical protein
MGIEPMMALTIRAVFERATVLSLLDGPELADNYALQAERDIKPASDHYLAVFVFAAEPLGDGGMALRIVSTTVLGIQRYTTTRLKYQGVHITNPPREGLLMETLRAHFRAHQEDTLERFMSVGSGIPLRWTKSFPNGAGDLASQSEFVIADPDLAELEKLFSLPDPRLGSEGGGEEI